MSKREYIVLRSTLPVATPHAGLSFDAAGFEPGMEGVKIEEAALSDAERSDMERDPTIKAVAETMPMTLIEPTESADAQPAAAATWGVEAVKATASPFDGSGVTVAVLDTGIDPNHAAFNGVTLERKNFTTGDDDDTNGHGTHCAGTIFGQDVSGQRIGIARNVSKAVIGKVLGPGGGSSATIVNAINWAVAQGAHVISMSLGIDFPGFVDTLVNTHGFDIRRATSIALVQYRANVNLFNTVAALVRAGGAVGQGTIIVAASGNEADRPQFTIAVAPPAAGIDIAAIGALGQGPNGLTVADFSNTEVDVSGPGVGVVSAVPGGGLGSKSGTSMATPHAAGVAALWAQRLLNPAGAVNAGALRAQLVARAETSPLAAGFRQEDVGQGIVQAPLG